MTKKAFMDLAEKAGIQVDYTRGRLRHPRTGELVAWDMILDAPAGHVFAGSGCHADCSFQGENVVTPNWGKETRRLLGVIAEGFDKCDIPDCDFCNTLSLSEDNS